jgi:hypothetical protein
MKSDAEAMRGVTPRCLFLRDEIVIEEGGRWQDANEGMWCDHCGCNIWHEDVGRDGLTQAFGYWWCRRCIEENESWEEKRDD